MVADALSDRFLAPPARGVEIGPSALNPFDGLLKWNVEQLAAEVFFAAQRRIAGGVARIDAFADADHLPFRDGSLDYVLASHVLEHMPDTLAALREWDRVVRPGGVVFLVVPHRDRTQDRDRARTPLRHLLHDFAVGMTVARSALVPTSHYHVWTGEDGRALLHLCIQERFLDWEVAAFEDPDRRAGNGFTMVARKRGVAPPLAARRPFDAGRIAFWFLALDLPFQVIGRDVEHVVDGATLRADLPLPRGAYRCTPVAGGFPPIAGPTRIVHVGAPAGIPILERAARDNDLLRFTGRGFTETTWLEARLPGDRTFRFLPRLDGGELVVDVAGFVLPDAPIPVRAVNLPPGGGAGPEISIRA